MRIALVCDELLSHPLVAACAVVLCPLCRAVFALALLPALCPPCLTAADGWRQLVRCAVTGGMRCVGARLWRALRLCIPQRRAGRAKTSSDGGSAASSERVASPPPLPSPAPCMHAHHAITALPSARRGGSGAARGRRRMEHVDPASDAASNRRERQMQNDRTRESIRREAIDHTRARRHHDHRRNRSSSNSSVEICSGRWPRHWHAVVWRAGVRAPLRHRCTIADERAMPQ